LRKIAVINQKGGVGKTTTVANIAAALGRMDNRVVVIDLDPQAHLTIHFGLDPDELDSGSYKVLTDSVPFDEQLHQVRRNVHLLPANIDLVGAESELVSVVGREIILRQAIKPFEEQFDYLLIDCAPSLGLLTLNALAAVDEILIPLQPHFLALQGFGKLLQTVDLVNKRINPALKVQWVLLCMFDTRASLPNEVRADIENFLNAARNKDCPWSTAQIMPIYIRRNIKLAEAPSYGKTIFEYAPDCHGSEDYRKVAEFLNGGKQAVQAEETEQSSDYQQTAENPEQTPEVRQPPPPEHSSGNDVTESVPKIPSVSSGNLPIRPIEDIKDRYARRIREETPENYRS